MFATEASVDLADEPELMQLMVDANFSDVFVGIESPNEASLRETKKTQNLRDRGGTMLDKVHRIQDVGMEVWCGMIVGFDNDDPSIFAAQRQFVQRFADHQRNREHAGGDTRGLHFTSGSPPKAGWTPRATRRISGRLAPMSCRCGSAETSCDRRICRADARPQRAGGVFRAGRGALYRCPSASRTNSRTPICAAIRCAACGSTRGCCSRHSAGILDAVDVGCTGSGVAPRIPALDPAGRPAPARRPEIIQSCAIKCAMHYHIHRMIEQMDASPPLAVPQAA